ncbi:uncharacterized protein SPSK_03370 [Sporothrix schenckii 1099-18]|uniref:Uncharacterized protein n=1 Tax=Sporothrix schenckii 1099-18 TaxID=1397361 RepID=A0A0F2LYI7_SPOSC|nr:uncharacterized protein SPSK_03370 [Sporothrix schenckii 1099-18]KJR82527.1 hypothetical protein SPSK_03370 [Sporothrix schenckii 1099-18]
MNMMQMKDAHLNGDKRYRNGNPKSFGKNSSTPEAACFGAPCSIPGSSIGCRGICGRSWVPASRFLALPAVHRKQFSKNPLASESNPPPPTQHHLSHTRRPSSPSSLLCLSPLRDPLANVAIAIDDTLNPGHLPPLLSRSLPSTRKSTSPNMFARSSLRSTRAFSGINVTKRAASTSSGAAEASPLRLNIAAAASTAVAIGSAAWYYHLYGPVAQAATPAEEGLHPAKYPWVHEQMFKTFDHQA